MKKQYLECGKIVATHGLRGEVKVMPWCDGPETLCGLSTLYLDGGKTPLRVERARPAKGMVLLKAEGVDTPEAAQALRGRVLWLDRAEDTLAEGPAGADGGGRRHRGGIRQPQRRHRDGGGQRRVPHHLPGRPGAADPGHPPGGDPD